MAASSRWDWRYVVAVVASLGLFGWFLWRLEWVEVGRALASVRPGWVALAALLVVIDFYARAGRWALLVRHFDRAAPLRDLWRATTIGNALNTVLPLRLGDVVRPMIVALKRQIPVATVLTTVVVERLLDAFGVVGAMLVVLGLIDRGTAGVALERVREWGLPAVLTAVVGLALVLALSSPRARVLAKGAISLAAPSARARWYRLYLQLRAGLAPARAPLRLMGGLAATAVVWAFTVLTIAAVLASLDIDLPVVASIFVAVALTVSITVPQAPGYLGLFQVVLAETLALWGATRAEAQAAALVLWAVYILPITAIGLVHGWLEAADLARVRAQLGPGDEGRPSA